MRTPIASLLAVTALSACALQGNDTRANLVGSWVCGQDASYYSDTAEERTPAAWCQDVSVSFSEDGTYDIAASEDCRFTELGPEGSWRTKGNTGLRMSRPGSGLTRGWVETDSPDQVRLVFSVLMNSHFVAPTSLSCNRTTYEGEQ